MKAKIVKRSKSAFVTAGASFTLVTFDDDSKAIEVCDMHGYDYFGPLTDEQVIAFWALQGVECIAGLSCSSLSQGVVNDES